MMMYYLNLYSIVFIAAFLIIAIADARTNIKAKLSTIATFVPVLVAIISKF